MQNSELEMQPVQQDTHGNVLANDILGEVEAKQGNPNTPIRRFGQSLLGMSHKIGRMKRWKGYVDPDVEKQQQQTVHWTTKVVGTPNEPKHEKEVGSSTNAIQSQLGSNGNSVPHVFGQSLLPTSQSFGRMKRWKRMVVFHAEKEQQETAHQATQVEGTQIEQKQEKEVGAIPHAIETIPLESNDAGCDPNSSNMVSATTMIRDEHRDICQCDKEFGTSTANVMVDTNSVNCHEFTKTNVVETIQSVVVVSDECGHVDNCSDTCNAPTITNCIGIGNRHNNDVAKMQPMTKKGKLMSHLHRLARGSNLKRSLDDLNDDDSSGAYIYILKDGYNSDDISAAAVSVMNSANSEPEENWKQCNYPDEETSHAVIDMLEKQQEGRCGEQVQEISCSTSASHCSNQKRRQLLHCQFDVRPCTQSKKLKTIPVDMMSMNNSPLNTETSKGNESVNCVVTVSTDTCDDDKESQVLAAEQTAFSESTMIQNDTNVDSVHSQTKERLSAIDVPTDDGKDTELIDLNGAANGTSTAAILSHISAEVFVETNVTEEENAEDTHEHNDAPSDNNDWGSNENEDEAYSTGGHDDYALDDEDDQPTFCKYIPYQSVPIDTNLAGVPAMLKMDVDSVYIFSKSLCKIIANLNITDTDGFVKIGNSISCLRVNESSRLYVQPDQNFQPQLFNKNYIKSPICLPRFPNIRLFDMKVGPYNFILSLYVLDIDTKLGKYKCKMNEKSLLAIVIALNIVRLQCRNLDVLQYCCPSDRISKVAQKIQGLSIFHVQKRGMVINSVLKSLDLLTGMALLACFEKALYKLAYGEWNNKYKDNDYNGHYISTNSDHLDEKNLREWATKLCQFGFFELSAIGMKDQCGCRKEAMLNDLSKRNQFSLQHKKLCQLVSIDAKNKIFTRNEKSDMISVGMNHSMIVSMDVGGELHPVVPGKNFVINGIIAEGLFSHMLQRTVTDEINHENSLVQKYKCESVHYLLAHKCAQYQNNPNSPKMPGYYKYDAECFSDPSLSDLFDQEGNPLAANQFMNGMTGEILPAADPDGNRVIQIHEHPFEQFIPMPFRLDDYLKHLLPITSESDLIERGMPVRLVNPDDDEGYISDDEFMDTLHHMGDRHENDDDDDEEYRGDDASATRVVQPEPITNVQVSLGAAVHEFIEEAVVALPNVETNDETSTYQYSDTNAGPFGVFHADDALDDNDCVMDFEFMAEAIANCKASKIYSQFLSDRQIGNVHNDRVILSVDSTECFPVGFQLTCHLHHKQREKCIVGVNIYSPFTRQLFLSQCSTREKLQCQMIPYLLQQIMSDVFEPPNANEEYQRLRQSVSFLDTRMKTLLTTLCQTDRLPIRQELTFATESIWANEFLWPTAHDNIPVSAHIGVCESRDMYYFTKQLYEESMIPLSHVVSQLTIPNFRLLMPESKTSLVYQCERVIRFYQTERFRGQISRYIKHHYPTHQESTPPLSIVTSISANDEFNTKLRYGIQPQCLPTFAVNPANVEKTFRTKLHSADDWYIAAMSKKIDCPREYLFHKHALLAVFQQFSRNVNLPVNVELTHNTASVGTAGNNPIHGAQIHHQSHSTALDSDTSINTSGEDPKYATFGFFELVDFPKLASLPQPEVKKLIVALSQVLCSAYGIVWLSRLNKKFHLSLQRLPRNADEMALLEDKAKSDLKMSSSGNIPESVPKNQRDIITSPGTCTMRHIATTRNHVHWNLSLTKRELYMYT